MAGSGSFSSRRRPQHQRRRPIAALFASAVVAISAACPSPPTSAFLSAVDAFQPAARPSWSRPLKSAAASLRSSRLDRYVDSAQSSPSSSLLLSPPPQKVLDYVSSTPGRSSHKVIPSDLSAATGMTLSEARTHLSTLASLTGAQMSVTADGEILYRFPHDVGAVLRRKYWKYRARSVAERAWPGLYYGIRVSFGVALLASIVAIFATLAAISAGAAAAQEEEDRRGESFGGTRHGPAMNINLFGPNLWGPSPFDFFYYRPYGGYGYYGRRRRGRSGGSRLLSPSEASYGSSELLRERPGLRREGVREGAERAADLSYLESVFSFVFGDGNPNAGLDETRLRSAASFVRSAGGAVTAEQLAVFLPDVPSSAMVSNDDDEFSAGDNLDGAYVDESYVLPLVLALGGEPTVTDDGDIVYVFPEMMKSASFPADSYTIGSYGALASRRTDPIPVRPEEVEETELQFSVADGTQKTLALGLGVVNLLGALSLGGALSKNPTLKLVGIYGTVQRAYPYLLSYAIMYNVIPLVRFIRMKRQNGKIRERNSRRRRWMAAVRSAGGAVSRKIGAARRLGRRMSRVDDDPVVFNTEMDGAERDRRSVQQDLRDFDERLK